ncbi:hypothetical protein GAYE_SCF42G5587 [Galdieria yellowstonensis]|uniref:Uncharacterized protein n=1 Tax=Galdieria yellowstonensis TaxID=3028027 RepID=A0AAV9IJR3_9RHOD|nr:hypothetical protein GAYE_SCF42G5587 [Galdieria yellowstonensis]
MLNAISPFGVARYPPLYYGNSRKNTKRSKRKDNWMSHEQVEEGTGSLVTIPEEVCMNKSPRMSESPCLENSCCTLSQEEEEDEHQGKEDAREVFVSSSLQGSTTEQKKQPSQQTPYPRYYAFLASKDSCGDKERQSSFSRDLQGWLLLSKIKSLALEFLLWYIEGVTLSPETIQTIRRKMYSSCHERDACVEKNK